jgi:hypothetical protein
MLRVSDSNKKLPILCSVATHVLQWKLAYLEKLWLGILVYLFWENNDRRNTQETQTGAFSPRLQDRCFQWHSTPINSRKRALHDLPLDIGDAPSSECWPSSFARSLDTSWRTSDLSNARNGSCIEALSKYRQVTTKYASTLVLRYRPFKVLRCLK